MQNSTGSVVTKTVLAVLTVLVAGGLVFIYSGFYDVAASDPHTRLGRWALNTTQERSLAAHARQAPEPVEVDSALLVHGFEHYDAMCVVCHGAPGIDRGEFGQGMTPTPPDLVEEADAWTARELFWVVKHGIKLAGMPAFGPTHTDEELWAIVAAVRQLPELSPEEYQRTVGAAGSDGENDGEGGHTHAPGTPEHQH